MKQKVFGLKIMKLPYNICDNKAIIYLMSVVAIVLWGMSYLWSDKLIAMGISIFYFVPIRILVAGVILLLFNLTTREFKKMAKKDLWKFLLLALCEPLIYFLAETLGIQETGSPTISAVIIASVPIFSVSVGVLFFKEKMTGLNLFGIFATLAGITIVVMLQKEDCNPKHFVLGIILLMIAVFAEVGHASLTKILASDYRPQVIVMYQFLIGCVYFLPVFLTKGLKNFSPVYVSWEAIEPILCLAVLCSSLAFSLWAMAIKRLGVGKSSVFLAMMCVATALIAEMMGREHLTTLQWLGVIIGVIGIILSQLAPRRKEKLEVAES